MPFVAVTEITSVTPASAPVVTRVWPVAPAMSTQAPPRESQRCHWYAKVADGSVHVPCEEVRIAPTCGRPEIVGGAVFAGAAAASAAPDHAAPTSSTARRTASRRRDEVTPVTSAARRGKL